MDVAICAFFAWLGLYLFRRNIRDTALILAGSGGLTYAAAVAAYALDAGEAVRLGLALAAAALWFASAAAKAGAIRDVWREGPRPRAIGLIGVSALLLSLSAAGLILPLQLLPRDLTLLLLGIDGVLLALGIAAFDAFELGEALRRDMLGSGARSAVMGGVFGGQAALLGAPLPAALAITVSAVLSPLLAGPAQAALDRLIFARRPALLRARANLRETADALPRAADHSDLASLDEADFARLTRRALSALTDLPRLSSSALLYLPQVDAHLRESGASDNVLERAAVLKAILAESVERLKPRGEGDFGTTDAWRHYNALYWPYIAGLKPYSARSFEQPAGDDAAALAWFQQQVPERTLYNWQNAAARLVARDLRERMAP